MAKSRYLNVRVYGTLIAYNGITFYMADIKKIHHNIPIFGREHLLLEMIERQSQTIYIDNNPKKRQIIQDAINFHAEFWQKKNKDESRRQEALQSKQLKRSLTQSGPESLVVEHVFQILTRQLGYRTQDIEQEFYINMGSSRKRLDIVVFKYGYAHEQQNIVLIVECKKASHNDTKGLARDQLYSYMSATGSARYGILATSTWQVFEKVQDNTLVPIPSAPAANNTFVAVSYNPPRQFEPIPFYSVPTQDRPLSPLPDNRLERESHYKQSSYLLGNIVSSIFNNNVLLSVSIISMIVIPMICINLTMTGIRNLAKSFEPTSTPRIQIFAVDTPIPLRVIQADLTQNPPTYTATNIPSTRTLTLTLQPISTSTPTTTLRPTSTRTLIPTLRPTSTRTPIPTLEPDVFGKVGVGSQDRINLRANPSTTATILNTIFPSTRVKILNESDDGNWLEIELDNGQTGWVSSALVTLER